MVQSATQYGLRARALDLKWSKRKVYGSEDLAQPAAQATVAAGKSSLVPQKLLVWIPIAQCSS